MKRLLWGLVGLCGVLGLILVGQLLFFAGRAVKTEHQVVNQTFTGTNVLYNYDWFYGHYNDYLALKVQWQEAQAALVAYQKTLPPQPTFAQQEQLNQDETNVQGIQYQLAQLVANYNAHAAEVNRGIFRSGTLPRHLSMALGG